MIFCLGSQVLKMNGLSSLTVTSIHKTYGSSLWKFSKINFSITATIQKQQTTTEYKQRLG